MAFSLRWAFFIWTCYTCLGHSWGVVGAVLFCILMWLFWMQSSWCDFLKKNSRLCEDCLLHRWYDWNSSFVSLTGRIIFLQTSYEVKSLNRFRTVSPLLITIERKTAKQEKILVWILCGHQKSFREKELGEITSQLHFQGLGQTKGFLVTNGNLMF